MEEKYPIEKSGHGTNTFYVGCEHLGRPQNYAVCQHVIRKVNDGTIQEHQFPDCQKAIRNGKCESVGLMKEEQEAGHALYYKPRAVHSEPAKNPSSSYITRTTDTDSESYKRGRYGKSSVTKSKSDGQTIYAPPGNFKPKPSKPQISEISAADIVNAAMEDDAQAPSKPETPKTPQPELADLPPRERGESPIAYRRRIKELTNNA